MLGRPGQHDVGEWVAKPLGDGPQGIDEVEGSLKLNALEDWVFMAAVAHREHLATPHPPRQQALHQRPVGNHRHAVGHAPGEYLGLDLSLEHVELHLACGQRALGREPRQVLR